MYQKLIFTGRLGKDPEIKTLDSGKQVGTLSVATDYGFGDKKKTEWLSVVVWDKVAESCAKYLTKGRLITGDGRLETRSWEKDGTKHYKTEVIANTIQFLPSGENKSDTQMSNGSAPSADLSEEVPF